MTRVTRQQATRSANGGGIAVIKAGADLVSRELSGLKSYLPVIAAAQRRTLPFPCQHGWCDRDTNAAVDQRSQGARLQGAG